MPDPKATLEAEAEVEAKIRSAPGSATRPAATGVAESTHPAHADIDHLAPTAARAETDRSAAFTLRTAADHAPPAPTADQAAVAAVPATRQDWLAKVYSEAGIDPRTWDVDKGFTANKDNVTRSYEWYAHQYQQHPQEMQWAGMAKLAGARVYEGLEEVEAMKKATAPTWWKEPNLAESVIYLQSMSMEKQFLTMQKEVFQDLAWQHKAYAEKGLPEIERLAKSGDLTNPEQLEGWRLIAQGKTAQGNEKILHAEQHDILQPHWAQITQGLVGGAIDSEISRKTLSPVPGGQPFRTFEPDGAIGDFADRWKWISQDMTPAWQHLPAEKRMELVTTPLTTLVAKNHEADGK